MSTAVDNEPGSSRAPPTPSASSPKPGTEELQPVRDEEYFTEDYFVTFEVGSRLFRVPTYHFFKGSDDFAEIYNLRACAQDTSDPITLNQVNHNDFHNFLKALYPLSVSLQFSLSKEEWISVLILSSEWRFLRLRETARVELERLSTLTSVEQICLGRQLRISHWVVQGFTDLVQQSETISDDEAIDIDLEVVTTAYKLFRLRELKIAGRLSSTKSAVENTFKEDLDLIRSEEKNFDNEEILRMKAENLKREEEKLMQEEEEKRQKEQERLKRIRRIEEKRMHEQRQREEEEHRRIEEAKAAREKAEKEREEAERLSGLRRKLEANKKNRR